jgi:tetratricopeptide (TPR) repeat protein
MDDQDLGARFKLGVAQRRQGQFDEASKTFDQVAGIDKEFPGLALERGLLFEATGRADEALAAYEAALAKAPNDPDLMLRVGCGNVASGRAQQAEPLLRKVLTLRSASAETNHCLGRALLLQSKLADAQRLLDRAVELDPNRAEYHLYMGWAASEAGNLVKAERSLDQALRLDQALADGFWQRGVLRQRQGAVRDAVIDLRKALELRPSRLEVHAALAAALYDLGKEREALAEWALAVKAQPDNALWRFRYGRLLVQNQMGAQAVEHLAKAIELGEKETPAPRWLWEAHQSMARALGAQPAAAAHWEAFLRLGPQNSPYRGEAKAALKRLGRPWSGP